MNGNGTAAPPPPLDFSTTAASSLEDREQLQAVNLSEQLPLDSPMEELRRKYPTKYPAGIPLPLSADLRLDRDIRDCGNKVSANNHTDAFTINLSCLQKWSCKTIGVQRHAVLTIES